MIGRIRALGSFKMSMLQDLEHGKPVEIDALLTVTHDMACSSGCQRHSLTAFWVWPGCEPLAWDRSLELHNTLPATDGACRPPRPYATAPRIRSWRSRRFMAVSSRVCHPIRSTLRHDNNRICPICVGAGKPHCNSFTGSPFIPRSVIGCIC